MALKQWLRALTARTRTSSNRKLARKFEQLEDRYAPAAITGDTGPGGFEVADGTQTLALWLDGSDIDGNFSPDALANGSSVSVWSDKSGYGRDATQAAGNGQAPTYVLASAPGNNMPAVNFNVSGGADNLRTTYNFDGLGADYSIFAVSRYTGSSNNRVISSGTRNWLFGHHGGGDDRWYAEGWITQAGTGSTAFNTYSGIIGPTVNGNAGDPGADFWKNGTQLANNNQGSSNTIYKPGTISLGRWQTGEDSNAEIAELIIVNRYVNETERRIIENALAAKYNTVQAVAQNVYLGDDNANGEFDLGVFGIGRLSSTDQLLSAGQFGMGIEAASLADDGDFVLAGHKSLANSLTSVTGLTGVENRWSRTWYVDETDVNNNANVTLHFDFSDAGLTLTNENRFSLLRSADGGATFSVVQQVDLGSPNVVGDRVSFNLTAADLQDGVYTLGVSSSLPLVQPTGTPLSYSIGDGNVLLDFAISVDDLDSADLQGATVTIGGFMPGDQDVLFFINQSGISGSYSNGVLTLTGVSSVANYEMALRSVGYSTTDANTPTRTVTFALTDTEDNVGTGTRDVTIQAAGTPLRFIWDGGGDGVTFGDANNWDRNIVPGSADAAVFANVDPGTVNLTGLQYQVAELRFENSAGAFALENGQIITDVLTHTGTSRVEIAAQLVSSEDQAITTTATLALTNLTNILSGAWTVSGGGTLEFAAQGTTDALGDMVLNVTDTTLRPLGLESLGSGIHHYGFHINNDGVAMNLDNNAGMVNGNPPNPTAFTNYFGKEVLTDGPGNRGIDFNSDQDFIDTGAIGQVDNYSNLFIATLRVTPATAGNWSFRIAAQDDPTGIWIDLNQNGIFESSTAGLGSNRGEQLSWNETGNKTVTLAAGDYLIAFTHREGGGGSQIDARFRSPLMGAEAVVKPSDPAQAGLWLTSYVNPTIDNEINVGAGVTFVNPADSTAKVTYLDVNGASGITLDLTGGGEIVFDTPELQGQTTVNTASGLTATLRTVADVGGVTGLTATGAGRVKLTTNNTYTGQTIVSSGVTLQASAAAALGAGDGTEATGTIVQSGGTLQIAAAHTSNEFTMLNGTGVGGVGALFSNTDFAGGIRLDSPSLIHGSGGTFRMLRPVDLNGQNVEFRTTNQVEVVNGGITGAGDITKSGNDRFIVNNNASAGTDFSGTLTITAGIWDARGANALGTTAGGTIINGGRLEVREATFTLADNITINNRDGGGSIRLENNSVTLTGLITATVDTYIFTNNTSLTITNSIVGGRRIDKGGAGLLWLQSANTISQLDLQGGTLRISNQGSLGNTSDISLNGGETLEIDGGFNFGPVFGQPLSTIGMYGGTINALTGTTTIDSTIVAGLTSDVNVTGAGNLIINRGFGNGSAPTTNNFLNHYGYHVNNDAVVMDLNNNAGMVNGTPPNPLAFPNLFGSTILTTGPGNRGLDFDSDGDFTGTGAIGQADNYSNLFIGILHVTPATAGDWHFRIAVQDDPTGIWLDLNRNGVFESTTAGLGSDRGEQLRWSSTGDKIVNLAAGDYMVAFTHREGGGGSQIDARFRSPLMAGETVVKPADPAQAGMWSGIAAITPSTNLNKSGTGTLTLLGDNTYSGATNVNAGMLIAGHNNAFGAPGGDIVMGLGTSLGLQGNITVSGEDITGPDGTAAGAPGTIVNLGGANNFLGDITASQTPGNGQELSIVSVGGQLTIGTPGANTLDANYSRLTFDGAGNIVVNSDIVGETAPAVLGMANGYLFNGNTTRLPGDPNQLASKTLAGGQVWFANEINFINFWGSDILGLNNAGNPADPNNFGITFIGDLTIDGVGTATVRFRHTSADDANRIRIDANQNGVFETGATEDPYNGDQGGTFTTGSITLNRGVPIRVALMMREGGGGSRLQPEVSLDNGATWQRFDLDGMTGATFGQLVTPDQNLVKTGSGSLTLSGDNSAYDAAITVQTGTLVAASNSALGTTTVPTTVAQGATISVQNVTAMNETLEIGTGAFVDPQGAGLAATRVDFSSSAPLQVTVSNATGVTQPAAISYDFAGTGLPGPDNRFLLLSNGSEIQRVAVDDPLFVTGTIVTFSPVIVANSVYTLDTDSERTEIYWTGAVDGLWTNGANWEGGAAPSGINEAATFRDDKLSGAAVTTVSIAGSASFGAMLLQNSSASFTFQGGTLLTDAVSQTGSGTNIFSDTATITSSTFFGGVNAGTLRFLGLGNISTITAGQWLLNTGGRLNVFGSASANGLGASAVNIQLNGGTLDLDGVPNTNVALGHFGFNRYPGDQAMMDLNGNSAASMMSNGNPASHPNLTGQSLLTDGPGNRGLNFDSDADFQGVVGVPADNYTNLWIGTLTVTAATAGVWEFRDADRDDWAGIWLDLNQNGIFESSTPGLGSNRGEQLAWNDQGTKSVTLAPGNYMVAFTHLEGGGGSRMEFRVKSPTMAAQATIKPTDPAQAGYWSFVTTPTGAFGNNILLSANSTIEASNVAQFGTLTTASTGLQLDMIASAIGGGVILAGGASLGGNVTFSAANNAKVEIDGITQTAPANVTYTGAGTFTLPEAPVFSYSGTTIIQNSAIVVAQGETNSALADGLDQFGNVSAGVTISSSAQLQFSGWYDAGFGDPRTVRMPFTLSGNGSLIHTGGGNANLYAPVTLAGNGIIGNQGNEFRIRRGVVTNGFEITFDATANINMDDAAGIISGAGSVRKEGDSYLLLQTANTYQGATIVNNGRLDVLNNSALGAPNTTTVNDGGTIRFYNGWTGITENFIITGNGENGEGALRQENNTNRINGAVTLNGNSRIHANAVSLTITGQISGSGNLEKTGMGEIVFDNPNNTYVGDTSIVGGQLVITGTAGLGTTGGNDLSLSLGGVLGFRNVNATYNLPGTLTIGSVSGGFNNISGTTTINFDLNPAGDLILASDAGTFNVNGNINVSKFTDVLFRGAGGEIVVADGFGTGPAIAPVANALSHFGYHVNNDGAIMDLHNNGGMLAQGSPTVVPGFINSTTLTSGPGNRGLDFDSDADFIAAGVIAQNDNYSNLFVGYLHVSPALAGLWDFRIAVQDDPTGIWIDLDRDGVFESSAFGLGSDRGEQLLWNQAATRTVNLVAGDYLIAFTHREGGGGSQIDARFRSPAMGAEAVVKPSDPAQDGLWSSLKLGPDNNIVKTGNNRVTLLGDNPVNGVTILGGGLIAANSGAFGPADAPLIVDGGTVAFAGNIAVVKDSITASGAGGVGFGGAISNISGANTLTVTNMVAKDVASGGVVGFGSEGGQLTIDSPNPIDLRFSALALGGDGDIVINADFTKLTGSQDRPVFDAYLFNGNATNLPGAATQIAAKTFSGEAFYNDEQYIFGQLTDSIYYLNNNTNGFDPNNFGVTLIGELTIPGAGTVGVVFRNRDSDDNSRFRIDLDGDGIFETGAEDPFGGDQGGTPTTGSITLNRGQRYRVALQMREGGGGSRLRSELNINNEGFQRFNTAGIDDFATDATFDIRFTANSGITKTGAGTATLAGDNSALDGALTITGGVLVADGSTNGTASLGAPGGGITIDNGAALGLLNFGNLTSAVDDVTIVNGGFVNAGGDNTISTNITVLNRYQGEVFFDSQSAGDTLTIDSSFDIALSRIAVDGVGNTVINGTLSGDGASGPAPLTHHDVVLGIPTQTAGLDPIAFWEFNEGGGATATDSTGHGNTGAFTGAAAYSAGRTGGLDTALDVRSGGTVNVASAASGAFDAVATNNAVTLSLWVYVEPGQNPRNNTTFQLLSATSSRVTFVHLPWSDRVTYWDAGQGERVQTPAQSEASYEDGWHHWAFVKTSTGAFQGIYRDGVLLASGTGTQTFALPTLLQIAPDFRGQLDDISIYSTALSLVQIQELASPSTFNAAADNRLVKRGSGTLTITSSQNFSGGADIQAGLLLAENASGSATGPGPVTVTGGILGGTGTITGAITASNGGAVNNGLESPATGVLNTTVVNFNSGGDYTVEITGLNADTQYDQLRVAGSVNLNADSGAGADLIIDLGFTPTNGDTLVLIDNTGASPVAGTFAGLPENASFIVGDTTFRITYLYDAATNTPGVGNDVAIIADTPTIEFTSATYSDDEGSGTTLVVTLTRTGNLDLASQVLVTITGGTATGGAALPDDYDNTTFPQTVTFAIGADTAAVSLTIFDDVITDAAETIDFSVSPVVNGLIGAQSTAVFTIIDNDNQIPTVAADFPTVTVNEGQTAANTGTYNDGDAADDVTITASPIGGTTKTGTNTGTWNWSYLTSDDIAGQTITIQADDGHVGGTATTTFDLIVNNVAPTVALDPIAAISEGSSAIVTGTYTDPGIGDSHTVVVMWDDPNDATDSTFAVPAINTLTVSQTINSSTDAAVLTVTSVNLATGEVGFTIASHTYQDDGFAPGNVTTSDVSSITVTVTDDDTDSGSGFTTVTVNNEAPVFDLGPDVTLPLNVGSYASGPIPFTDAGVLDDWTASVDFGDGSAAMPLSLVGMTFSLNHNYVAPGTYTVTVMMTDDDGGITFDTVDVTVQAPTVVYVDDDFSSYSPGDTIPDADPVAAGAQPAVFGFNAHTTPNAGIAAVAVGGTVFQNGGTYNQAVVVNKAINYTFQEAPIDLDSLADTTPGATITLNAPLTVGSDNSDTAISSPIDGSASLTKVGTGVLTLTGTGANTFTGGATVMDGTLALDKTGAEALPGPVVIGDNAGGSRTAIVRVDQSNQIADTADISFVGGDGRLFIAAGTEIIANPLDLASGDIKVAGDLTLVSDFDQTAGATVTLAGGTLRIGADGDLDFSLAGTLHGSGTIYTKLLTSAGTIDPSSGNDGSLGNASPGRVNVRGNVLLTAAAVTNLDVGGSDSDQLNVGINTALALPSGSYQDLSNYDLDPYLRGDVVSVTEQGRRGVNDVRSVNGTVRLDGTLNVRPIAGSPPAPGSTAPAMNFVWRALNLPTGGAYPDLDPRGANLASVPSDFQTKNSLDVNGDPVASGGFDSRFMGSGGQFNAVGQSVATMTKIAGVTTAVLTAPAYNVGQAKSLTLTSLGVLATDDSIVRVTKQLWNAKKDSHTRVTLTVTNTSSTPQTGPFYIELVSVPNGAAVFNAAGKRSTTDRPYLVVPAATLAAGGSVTVEVDLLTPLTLGKFSSLSLQVFRGGMP